MEGMASTQNEIKQRMLAGVLSTMGVSEDSVIAQLAGAVSAVMARELLALEASFEKRLSEVLGSHSIHGYESNAAERCKYGYPELTQEMIGVVTSLLQAQEYNDKCGVPRPSSRHLLQVKSGPMVQKSISYNDWIGLIDAACGGQLDSVAHEVTRRMHRRDAAPGELETDNEYRVRIADTLRRQLGHLNHNLVEPFPAYAEVVVDDGDGMQGSTVDASKYLVEGVDYAMDTSGKIEWARAPVDPPHLPSRSIIIDDILDPSIATSRADREKMRAWVAGFEETEGQRLARFFERSEHDKVQSVQPPIDFFDTLEDA